MAKKKSIPRRQQFNFQPPSWGRYIYFSSLYEEGAAGISVANTAVANLSNLSQIAVEKQNEEGVISYIADYISKLRSWASAELTQEKKFIELVSKQGIEIKDYNKNGIFNYLIFIQDINIAYTSYEKYKETLHIHESNLSEITKALTNYTSNIKFSPKKDKDGNIIENEDDIPFISEKSIKHMHRLGKFPRVREGVQAALKQNHGHVRGNNFNIKNIKNQLSQILLSDDIIAAAQSAILNGISVSSIKNKVFNMALAALASNEQLNINTLSQAIAESIKTMATQDIEESYTNAVTWIEKTGSDQLEQFIQKAEKDGENLADLFELLDNDVRQDLFSSTSYKDNKLITPIKDAYDALQAGKKNDLAPRQIAGLKGVLSKALHAEVKKRLNNLKGAAKEKRDQLIQILQQTSINNNSINIRDILVSSINNFNITGPDYAEIVAAVQAATYSYGPAYIPGKLIKLKSDLLISYFLNPVPFEELQQTLTKKQYDAITNKINNFGKNFLTNYNKRSSGHTNIDEAKKAYVDELKKLARQKEKALKKAKTQQEKDKIDQLYKFLSTSISVKKYEDTAYINEGFHEGSLGGGGKVVDAIPNIVSMLDAGGISILDAETIITALLNSFDGSVIGRGYEQALKDYLLAGAAMVLFDDGFANAKNFLDNLSENVRAAAPGALHLIFVNDLYFPQSYILTEICNNLELVAKDITEKQRSIIYDNASTKIQLHNPISYNTLRAAQQYNSPEERWNYVKSEAESKVTINLVFMAGMLDIIQGLQQQLSNVDNL